MVRVDATLPRPDHPYLWTQDSKAMSRTGIARELCPSYRKLKEPREEPPRGEVVLANVLSSSEDERGTEKLHLRGPSNKILPQLLRDSVTLRNDKKVSIKK